MSKTALVQELRREMTEEPEEVHMGLGKKTKTSKYEDSLEELEQSQFKRVSMTKKEARAIKNKRQEEIQDRLENLDDDFAAVENILRHQNRQDADHTEISKPSASKFAKSLKQLQKQSYQKGGDRPRDKKRFEKTQSAIKSSEKAYRSHQDNRRR